MAHKTLIGGTAYEISGGRTLVGGTGYDISSGKTLVGGTAYDVSFWKPATAMLYSDGNFVFQADATVASGKTLTASYTNFEDVSSPPWDGNQTTFTSVNFNTKVSPTTMASWFYNARNMVANISTFSNLDMSNVTNMHQAYGSCYNLTGSPVCGDKVTDMYAAYMGCSNLTGSPVCGNNVTNMNMAYQGCHGLTGNVACGDKVTDMSYAYYSAYRATLKNPACGNNVTDMTYAYALCYNLTGSPVCGDKVTSMAKAYDGCNNLTGLPVCGNNVTNLYHAYRNCSNLSAGNSYFYSRNISNAYGCFSGKNNSRRYNIYVPAGSTTLSTFLVNNTRSLVGKNITWTQSGTTYYNTAYNIYIYATL